MDSRRYQPKWRDGLPPSVNSDIDGAGYGQDKVITFGFVVGPDGTKEKDAETIIDNTKNQTMQMTEPAVMSVAIGIDLSLEGTGGVDLSDVHVVAEVEYGCGSTRKGRIVASVGRGIQLSIPSNSYRVSARIEGVPDPGDPALIYPPPGTAIRVYAASGTGRRSGDLPTRNFYFAIAGGEIVPISKIINLPPYTRAITLLCSIPGQLALSQTNQIGPGGNTVQSNAIGTPPNELPVVAIAKQIEVFGGGVLAYYTLICHLDI